MIRKTVQYIRLRDWYDSKVPFVLCYLWCIYLHNSLSITTERFAAVFIGGALFTGLFLAFGYMINDYADRTVDAMAGKDKLMHHMSGSAIALSFVIVIAAGIFPILIVSNFSFLVGGTLIATYLIGAAYSMPPFRFKEKGVYGLIISSFAQRCMPVIVLSFLIRQEWSFTILFIVTSFIIGLRYILIHQIIDLENDRLSGVRTFASDHLKQVVFGVFVVFFIELILLGIIIVYVDSPILWGIVCLSAITEWTQCRMVTRFMGQRVMTTFCNVPLEGFENLMLPLALGCVCFIGAFKGTLPISGAVLPLLLLMITQIILLFGPSYRKLKLSAGYIRESGKVFMSDKMGTTIGLIQNFIMCVAISLTIALMNHKLNDLTDIMISVVLSFIINCMSDLLFEVGHFGKVFAGLFPLKEKSIAWKLVRNLLMVLIYVFIIGSCMYLIKIPNAHAAMHLFASQAVILYIVGVTVSLLAEPLSVGLAKKIIENSTGLNKD